MKKEGGNERREGGKEGRKERRKKERTNRTIILISLE